MKLRTTKPGLLLLILAMLAALPACTQQDAAPEQPAVAEGTPQPVAQETPTALPPRANNETRPSPNASVSQTIGTTEVTITYGRPGVKGRQVFGGLEKYGNVWRTGANEATVIAFSNDVTVDGQPLPAGAYALFAIPTEGDWTLIFNKQAGQWGAFDHDSAQDALRVTVTPEPGPKQEWLAYYFEDLSDTSAKAVLHWDTVRVPFTVAATR